MFRKPITWVIFVALFAASVAYAVRDFPRAFPIVSLDLRMDREGALASARRLAEEHGWGPGGYRQAAEFALDAEVQSFVELEAGGRDEFRRIIRDGLFAPYTWRVRHFREGETQETLVRFTPSGDSYGFVVKLPEDESGAKLESEAARRIAEEQASRLWRVGLERYDLVEHAQEERPGGRLDHTLVYERPDVRVGEGRYRLRLVIGGDRLTELTYFVKVPEAFSRRYEEMRSANEAIGAGSAVGVFVYLVGGCGVGLFYLLRRRWILWKQPLFWGLSIASLQALDEINQWPLTWMAYDTAVSYGNFVLHRVTMILIQLLALGALLTVSFMAAEGLTRRAFPHHIQLWRLWRKDVAGSHAVLGRTVAGYLLVGLFMAYEVLLYAFAQSKLGWWTPSDTLVDPNVLATYIPWLRSIAVSLQAGFWEESLFRAVPLAGAALIGQRLGGRSYWIAGAMLLQAAVFGAGHAAYATQPSYARLVELILPSFTFGLVYLRFGLLPTIVLHYALDVVWIGLPLFVSTAPGIWVNRLLILLLVLVPLWAAIGSRLRRGSRGEVEEKDLNRAWSPPPPREVPPAKSPARTAGLSPTQARVLAGIGVAGLILWVPLARLRSDVPSLRMSRARASATASDFLEERRARLPAGWRPLSDVEADPGTADRFVWQEGGPEAYRNLLGTYLAEPRWRVRHASFEGDVAARAEEQTVWVRRDGEVVRFRHQLPEAAPGAGLSGQEARAKAREVIQEVLALDPDRLEEVSVEPGKRPNRTDWTLTFRDPHAYELERGEARVRVEIAGDEVVDYERFVHVPEGWRRAERDRQTSVEVIQLGSGAAVVLMLGAGLVGAIVRWASGRFALGVFVVFAILMWVPGAVGLVNAWPATAASFSTARPFLLQTVLFVGFGLIGLAIVAAAVGMNLGLVHRWLPAPPPGGLRAALAAGAGLGASAAGVGALVSSLGPHLAPRWPSFDGADAAVPLLSAAFAPLGRFVTSTALVLLVVAAAGRLTRAWTCRRILVSALLFVVGLVMTGSKGPDTLGGWAAGGILTGAVLLGAYVFALRHDASSAPVATAVIMILDTLREVAARAYPGASAGHLIAALLVASLSFYWCQLLSRGVRD